MRAAAPWFRIFLLAVPCLWLTPAAPARAQDDGSPFLTMRSELVCTGPVFRVGEILADCADAELAARIVDRSPAPGAAGFLTRRRLARMLADWGFTGRLAGPERVELRSPGVELDGEPLSLVVLERLDAMLAERGLVRMGALSRWPERIVLSTARVKWDLRLDEKSRGAERSARLELTDAGGFGLQYELRFRCSRPGTIPVAGSDLAAGEALAGWEMMEGDLLALVEEPLDIEELMGAVARRGIEAGQPLTRRNVKPAVLVRGGREVEIHLARGAVTVSMSGIAQADGAMGDLVTVRHLDSSQLRRYRVTGPGRVSPTYLGEGS